MRVKPDTSLRNALVSFNAVLAVGFLGFGVRTIASAEITDFAFAAVCVISIAILVLYFVLSRRSRGLPLPKPPFKYYDATTGPNLKPSPEAATADLASRKLAA